MSEAEATAPTVATTDKPDDRVQARLDRLESELRALRWSLADVGMRMRGVALVGGRSRGKR